MGKVVAGITVSVDGSIPGPGDGPARAEPAGRDQEWLEEVLGANAAVVAGRRSHGAAGPWGDKNRGGIPASVLTHRPEPRPGGGFVFVDGPPTAVAPATAAAADSQVDITGGAQIIRPAPGAGVVDELAPIIAPLVLAAGEAVCDGYSRSIEPGQLSLRRSPFATVGRRPGREPSRSWPG